MSDSSEPQYVEFSDGLYSLIREVHEHNRCCAYNLVTGQISPIDPDDYLMIVIFAIKSKMLIYEIKIMWMRGYEPIFRPEHIASRSAAYDIIRDECNITARTVTVDGYNVNFSWNTSPPATQDEPVPTFIGNCPASVLEKAKSEIWTAIFDNCCDSHKWNKYKDGSNTKP